MTLHADVRALCDQLALLAAGGGRVIRVSSDLASAGSKSQLAAQIACSLAAAGRARVLLLEADFDDPGVGRVMRLESPAFRGFSQQLQHRSTTGERAPWSVARCGEFLSVLPEGHIRTPGFLASPTFALALAELRRSYDVIVVHGPPADAPVDTRALDGSTDGIVYAVASVASETRIAARSGGTSRAWIVRTEPASAPAQS